LFLKQSALDQFYASDDTVGGQRCVKAYMKTWTMRKRGLGQ